jgi:hypothetical protein
VVKHFNAGLASVIGRSVVVDAERCASASRGLFLFLLSVAKTDFMPRPKGKARGFFRGWLSKGLT